MDESDFEGTLVLEKLAENDRIDEFFDAIDSDDFFKVTKLMRQAGINEETIAIVLKKMSETNGEH